MVSIFAVDLGTSMTTVALPLLLIRDYGTTLAAGLTLAIRLVPSIAAGPIVGGLLARRDPRRIAMFSSLLSALFAALIPVCWALWQIQILTLGIGLAVMLAGPARLVLRPAVVSEGDERRGNGLLMAAQRVSTLSGPPMLGVIIAIGWPLWIVFFLEAATSLVAVVMMLRVPPLPSAAGGDVESTGAKDRGLLWTAYVTSTRALLRVISVDSFMRGATLTSFSYVLAVTLGRMMLVVMGEQHHSDISGFYGWMLAAMGVGGLCGSLLIGRFKRSSTGNPLRRRDADRGGGVAVPSVAGGLLRRARRDVHHRDHGVGRLRPVLRRGPDPDPTLRHGLLLRSIDPCRRCLHVPGERVRRMARGHVRPGRGNDRGRCDGNSDAPHRSLVLHTVAGWHQRDRFDAQRHEVRREKGKA
ncbi:MFS transporter [Streptomyces sp. 900116325]